MRNRLAAVLLAATVSLSGAVACQQAVEDEVRQRAGDKVQQEKEKIEKRVNEEREKVEKQAKEAQQKVGREVDEARKQVEEKAGQQQ
jgi:ElaB/YqjD/DUF883 family membrane-anchored ribosome-binding protein